jgi:hypothetical protein
MFAECKLDAHLARIGSDGEVTGFSRAMALRRLHWRNSPLAEALYALNLYKVRATPGSARLSGQGSIAQLPLRRCACARKSRCSSFCVPARQTWC